MLVGVTFNSILTLMLAKFVLNDVPHALGITSPLTNPAYEEPPTPQQLRYIAILCMRLGIKRPLEETVRTKGEAGRLIRELQAEERHRKTQKGGNPYPQTVKYKCPECGEVWESPYPNVQIICPRCGGLREWVKDSPFTIRRTTVGKPLCDELVRVWARIGSDTSIKMQKSVDELKSIMGYHYEKDAIVAEEGGELVGVAVYEPLYIHDFGTTGMHISELASFTHRPGVGKALVEEVVRTAREKGSDFVSAKHGPGARGFYEKMGFEHAPRSNEPEFMIRRL